MFFAEKDVARYKECHKDLPVSSDVIQDPRSKCSPVPDTSVIMADSPLKLERNSKHQQYMYSLIKTNHLPR
jgi:hypothetical protein